MKAPHFWYKKGHFLGKILTPLSYLYYLGFYLSRKVFVSPERLFFKTKIVCVGNLTVGGAGKTMVCIKIAEILKSEGFSFCFITRGYKRCSTGFMKVSNQNPLKYGDEPCLLFEFGDVFVYSDINQISAIKDGEYDYIIMDDGLQNNKIFKDKKLLVVDEKFGFGNEKLLPAGPLRCKITDVAFDNIVYLHKHKQNTLNQGLNMQLLMSFPMEPCKVVVFAGLGNNTSFFESLRTYGFVIEKAYEFEDHHIYTEEDLTFVNTADLPVITTKKDYIKVPHHLKSKINVVNTEIIIDNKDCHNLINLLKS